MPRGGKRVGAGRKADPNSKRQQALAKRTAKAPAKDRGLTLPSGEKSPDAPAEWPFGTKPAAAPAESPKEPDPESDDGLTDEQRSGLSPLDYLLAVMRSPDASKSARMTAAIQAAPYLHAKPAPMGKKQAKDDAARKVSSGRFGATTAPKLAAANGKRL